MSIKCCQFSRKISSASLHKRSMFHWINLQFNVVDEQRRKQFGPDRSCAEWILRNGGTVKLVNSSAYVSDYNKLPKEGTRLYLQEVNGTEASLMDNGFEHFKNCNYITKIILHKSEYLENKALDKLVYLNKSLLHLQLSSCPNISEEGLFKLNGLSKLRQLVIFDLENINNLDKVAENLKHNLPECNVKLLQF